MEEGISPIIRSMFGASCAILGILPGIKITRVVPAVLQREPSKDSSLADRSGNFGDVNVQEKWLSGR
jgi:hypothetical protein